MWFLVNIVICFVSVVLVNEYGYMVRIKKKWLIVNSLCKYRFKSVI